MDLRGTDF